MKRQVPLTSIQAYQEKQPNIGEDAQTVLVAFNAYPDSTDREIADKLGFKDPNKVRPRRYELARDGWLVCSGKRPCMITGKLAMTWRVKQK